MLTLISPVKIVNRAVQIMGPRVGSVKVSGERFQMAVKCSNYTGSRKFQTLVLSLQEEKYPGSNIFVRNV